MGPPDSTVELARRILAGSIWSQLEHGRPDVGESETRNQRSHQTKRVAECLGVEVKATFAARRRDYSPSSGTPLSSEAVRDRKRPVGADGELLRHALCRLKWAFFSRQTYLREADLRLAWWSGSAPFVGKASRTGLTR